MANTIAMQISDDFEWMMDDGKFGYPNEANEWLLDTVQTAAINHTQRDTMDVYTFNDNSKMLFKGNNYRVEVSA